MRCRPPVDKIERLERLILELDKTIGRHQQLLISVAGYKVALEVSYAAEAELPELQANVILYDDMVKDMVKVLAPGAIPSWMIAEALMALRNVSIRST
jgi:hypothetical protein